MQATIVTFPETRVAFISHIGPPSGEHDTMRKLIAWKLAHKLFDQLHYRSYGLHYTDPRTTRPDDYRVDFCLSYDHPVEPNPFGIGGMIIPAMRCALARDIGSRHDNLAARFLHDEWLPVSGERMANRPMLFHYVNVGPQVKSHEAVTDVYLPLA